LLGDRMRWMRTSRVATGADAECIDAGGLPVARVARRPSGAAPAAGEEGAGSFLEVECIEIRPTRLDLGGERALDVVPRGDQRRRALSRGLLLLGRRRPRPRRLDRAGGLGLVGGEDHHLVTAGDRAIVAGHAELAVGDDPAGSDPVLALLRD